MKTVIGGSCLRDAGDGDTQAARSPVIPEGARIGLD